MALRFVQIVVVGRNNSMGRKGDDFRNFSISIALYKRNGFLKFFNFYDNSRLSFQIYIFFFIIYLHEIRYILLHVSNFWCFWCFMIFACSRDFLLFIRT